MTIDFPWLLSWAVVILEVAIALGLVIFVHELGHFAVAKLCGVKCEKFYLGFDIYGLKLCKFQWGETEYGIGILPLGGYVKMLGQEDNPAKLREEIERAKQQAAAADGAQAGAEQPPAETAADRDGDEPELTKAELAEAEAALYDPRSYLAQSVPKRMAIISAGVIMNVIFAFVAAVIGLRIGTTDEASVVGTVVPGSPAWQAGFKPGDRIVEIGGNKTQRFAELMENISLGDNLHEGLPIVIQRPGEKDLITKTVVPTTGGRAPTIGVGQPYSAKLHRQIAALRGLAAAASVPKLKPGDTITEIDGVKIENYAQLHTALARSVDKPIEVVVRRSHDGEAEAELLPVKIPLNPMRTLGLEMKMGEIAAIQADSPAAAAGLKVGDILDKVDDQPVGDPMTLPDRLRKRAGDTVVLTIIREKSAIPIKVKLSRTDCYEQNFVNGTPVAIPELGVAYQVLNVVQRTDEDSPAAAGGLSNGNRIEKAVILPPKQTDEAQENITLKFTEKQRNWPKLMTLLQALPGSKVELTYQDGSESKTVTLTPVEAKDWNNPDRGLALQAEQVKRVADSWGEAVKMGWGETKSALLMVVNVVRKLSSGDVSPRMIGGPGTILGAAAHFAQKGLGDLLIFITIISANLAVLNFLPIPVLDGGHMVFLTWEGIRGKPADERVQLVLTYIGLGLILALMVWALGLDFGLISREVPPK